MPVAPAPALRARSRSLLLVGSLAALAVLGLAGCSAEPAPEKTPGGASTAEPTEAPSAEPTVEPTAEPGTPITIDCEILLTPQDIYDFNPNVSTDPNFAPAEGTLAAAAVADNGIACGYLNQTSNELMNFSLSQPSPEQLTLALNAAAGSSTPVPTYGTPPAVNGFFDPATGQIQVFTPTYWLTATSTMFGEPGDAEPLVRAAISHLPE